MYSTQFLPLVIHHFKFSYLIRSVPFDFDAKSGKLVLIKERKRILATQVQSILSLMYIIVLSYHFILGKLPMLKMLQGFPFLLSYMLLLSTGWNVGLDIAPIQMINSILNFEKDLLKGIGNSGCRYSAGTLQIWFFTVHRWRKYQNVSGIKGDGALRLLDGVHYNCRATCGGPIDHDGPLHSPFPFIYVSSLHQYLVDVIRTGNSCRPV